MSIAGKLTRDGWLLFATRCSRMFAYGLQFTIPLNHPSMPALPIAHLTPQLDVFCTQFRDFVTQFRHQSPSRLQLLLNRIPFQTCGSHNAEN